MSLHPIRAHLAGLLLQLLLVQLPPRGMSLHAEYSHLTWPLVRLLLAQLIDKRLGLKALSFDEAAFLASGGNDNPTGT
jgi:hypothetical protein